ncbi:hypothetical protein AnigIFM56816_001271 [Aspergillus niger]|nr:hypothetical protein AnigIFM56816_001271 [Aspergillus niger]
MESLPPELFNAIATRLAYLRIHVLVTPEGIADLKALASHETIRPAVQDLCLIPPLSRNHDLPLAEFTEVLRRNPEGRDWTSEEIQAHYKVYKATHAAHLMFAQSDSVVSNIAECLAQFDNLRSIGLDAYPLARFPRRGKPAACLGLRGLERGPLYSLFEQKLVRHSQRPHPSYNWLGANHPAWNKVLTSVLQALCMVSSSVAIQRLYTCSLRWNVVLPAAYLTFSKPLYEPLAFCLRDLRVLEVCLGPGSPEDAREDCLPGLITRAAPTLRTLKLFQWAQMQDSSPDIFADLAPQIPFSRLVRLHLHWVEVTQSDFALFLRSAAPSLRVLTLVALNLKDHLPDSLERTTVLKAIWRNFRNILQVTIPSIHVFAMTRISCRRHQLCFTKSCREGQSPSSTIKHFSRLVSFPLDYFSYHANQTPTTFADWLDTLDLDPETPLARDLPVLSGGSHSLRIGNPVPNLGDEVNKAAAETFELGSP